MFHNMYESVLRSQWHEAQLDRAVSSPRSVSHDSRARRLSRKAELAAREARLAMARAL
jgi:hypothetical protein